MICIIIISTSSSTCQQIDAVGRSYAIYENYIICIKGCQMICDVPIRHRYTGRLNSLMAMLVDYLHVGRACNLYTTRCKSHIHTSSRLWSQHNWGSTLVAGIVYWWWLADCCMHACRHCLAISFAMASGWVATLAQHSDILTLVTFDAQRKLNGLLEFRRTNSDLFICLICRQMYCTVLQPTTGHVFIYV